VTLSLGGRAASLPNLARVTLPAALDDGTQSTRFWAPWGLAEQGFARVRAVVGDGTIVWCRLPS